jgi:hypothetical protein
MIIKTGEVKITAGGMAPPRLRPKVYVQYFHFSGNKGLQANGIDAMKWAKRHLDRAIVKATKNIELHGDIYFGGSRGTHRS